MAIARQTYGADGSYVDKNLKEFSLTQEVIEKLDSIEPGAERNFIQGIKVNGEQQTPDEFRVVNISVPLVEDSLNSTDIRKALSAKQGKILYEYIKSLQSLGRFLSNWNATTGMPTSNPETIPYEYHSGDYYMVSVVGNTNYRPEGTVYSGAASSTVESENIDVSDIYIYDDGQWLLLHNSARAIAIDSALSSSSTNPVENRVITGALNTKQGTLTAGNNIQLNGNVISSTDTTYDNLPASQGGTDESLVTTGDKYNWNNKQDKLQAGTNIQINGNTISATDTVYGAGANIQINNNIISATDTTYTASDFDIKDLSDSTNKRTYWDNKQEKIIAGNNITIGTDGKTINAIDTTYTAGQGIDITNGVISNTQTSAEWGNITGTLSDQTDLQTALNGKQNTISDLATIRSGAALGTTSLQPNDNISELNNDTGYITGVDWGDIGGTLSDQTDLNTALGAKANDNAVVKLTGAQTINGAKTFGTSPIVPAKSTDAAAANTTVIATEAQVAKKQNTLVSGTNIKTINGNNILGSGNLTISGLPSGGTNGQILMIVSGTPTWVTPTAKGFKMLSPNSPLTVPYDWYGTEAQYSSATKSNDTEYRTV